MNVPKDNQGLEDQFMNEKFIQFRTGCEDERDPTACYSLGEWYAVTSQNYDKARGYYEFACDNGHGNACFSLGVLYLKGLGNLERSREKAATYWKKACDVQHDRACHMVSEMYHYGVGVPKNLSLAQQIRKSTCDRGHADSCHALGVSYLTSTGKARDASKALEPLSRACERGHGGACHNLAVMYRKGDGVKQSDTLFEKFARLAETLNSQTVRRS